MTPPSIASSASCCCAPDIRKKDCAGCTVPYASIRRTPRRAKLWRTIMKRQKPSRNSEVCGLRFDSNRDIQEVSHLELPRTVIRTLHGLCNEIVGQAFQ